MFSVFVKYLMYLKHKIILTKCTPVTAVKKDIAMTDDTTLQRGLIRPRWREVAVPVLWPVPEAAVTVFSTPDNGCCDTRNM